MSRKTIEVEKIKEMVNERLATSKDGGFMNPSFRYGLCAILEQILHETDNYKGYWSLRPDQVPEGQKPGIIFDESPAHNHQYPDDSRRRYF